MKKTKTKSVPAVRVILVTAPEKDAERLARALVEERLAACANLAPHVTSFYWWQGKLNCDAETLIVFKTAPRLVGKLLKRLKELHSYQVPEFLALPVLEANPDYAKWVHEVTGEN
jgi:periplasmic divalent cation tolerance protein